MSTAFSVAAIDFLQEYNSLLLAPYQIRDISPRAKICFLHAQMSEYKLAESLLRERETLLNSLFCPATEKSLDHAEKQAQAEPGDCCIHGV